MRAPRFGAIEAGGSKFVCAVGAPTGELISEVRIPTTSPTETLDKVASFFGSSDTPLAGVGLGSFGPIQLHEDSSSFGFITSTPKKAWRNVDIVGMLRERLGVPITFDTDVNAAALAEATWGGGRGLRTFLYVTVGTGIGAAAIVDGSPLHGLLHPEMGHIRVPHDLNRDPFPGVCPFHLDCLEGLASGPALAARWGAAPETLAPNHPAWELEAEYLALACVNWICTLSPQRVLFGGGVMQQNLLPRIRERVLTLLADYITVPEIIGEIDRFIISSPLAGRAGIMGGLALAARGVR